MGHATRGFRQRYCISGGEQHYTSADFSSDGASHQRRSLALLAVDIEKSLKTTTVGPIWTRLSGLMLQFDGLHRDEQICHGAFCATRFSNQVGIVKGERC